MKNTRVDSNTSLAAPHRHNNNERLLALDAQAVRWYRRRRRDTCPLPCGTRRRPLNPALGEVAGRRRRHVVRPRPRRPPRRLRHLAYRLGPESGRASDVRVPTERRRIVAGARVGEGEVDAAARRTAHERARRAVRIQSQAPVVRARPHAAPRRHIATCARLFRAQVPPGSWSEKSADRAPHRVTT